MNRDILKQKLYLKNEYDYIYQNPSAVLDSQDVEFAQKTWGIKTDVHRTCVNCQIRQMLKYEGKVDPETGERVTKFTVPCNYIPKSLPKGSDKLLNKMIQDDGISEERALLLLQSTMDPVAWAELMFGFRDTDPKWSIRNYQKEQLRCTAERIVIREGRRSGKTFAVALKLLYWVFNRIVSLGLDSDGNPVDGGPTIMIITPYMSQLLNVFDEMEKILKRNKDLCEEVETGSAGSLYVKTPFFRMAFKNRAEIKGFVSGVGTKTDGSGGGTMRGQAAHVLYLDEMDMIPEETIEKVIMPIILSDQDKVDLVVTSTPIGKRGKFYKMCLENPNFKEDYLPSSVLPQWERNKRLIVGDASKEAIQREYMAAFIDAEFGVFKPTYVYRGMKDYKYEQTESLIWWKKTFGLHDTKQLVRVIGIDWNKNAGTEFVITTYIPSLGTYVVNECVNIASGEFSALKWREELIRLNYKWKPNYIYADEGYGHTIIEDCKVIAFSLLKKVNKSPQDMETVKLGERLKSYNFKSKVKLRNPIDGTEFEKEGKEFLVENTQRLMEDPGRTGAGVIWFPEEDVQLKNELMNYVVLRRSPTTNKPVYGPESDTIGDHRLDAFMLSLAGIQIEMGLYSESNMALSEPGFLDKETLESRKPKDLQEALGTVNPFVGKSTLQLLNIERSYGSSVVPETTKIKHRNPKYAGDPLENNSFHGFIENIPVGHNYEIADPVDNRSNRGHFKRDPNSYKIHKRRLL